MEPIVAIVGRPNVGKSTLFNRIAGRRKAVVGDEIGITRDRNYAQVSWNDRTFLLVDTGGFETGIEDEIKRNVSQQIELALREADVIIFVADGKEGLTPSDIEAADRLRRVNKPVLHVVNKIDSRKHEERIFEFYQLGIKDIYPVSAEHGRGVGDLLDGAVEFFPPFSGTEPEENRVRIAVLGRPNAGKSSLVNRILRDERVIVSEMPGTTRDVIDTPLRIEGREYLLIDTPGIRRKAKIKSLMEKYSIVQSFKCIDRCDVALIVIDAKEGIKEQDAKIAGRAHERGKASVLVMNKWDLIEKDTHTVSKYVEDARYNLKFMRYAPMSFVSALTGQRVAKIINLVNRVTEQYQSRVKTSDLNRVFEEILHSNPPPLYGNKPLKMYYITQTSIKPPTFIVFVNYPKGVHFSYERYIVNRIRENFGFKETPVRVLFRRREKGFNGKR